MTQIGKQTNSLATVVLGVMFIATAATSAHAAAKPKREPVRASGSVTLTGATCPVGTASSDVCYMIDSSNIQQGSVTDGTLSGMLIVDPTASKRARPTTCYTLNGASRETLTIGGIILDIDFGPARICIVTRTTKNETTTIEAVMPAGRWKTVNGSPNTGRGRETWRVTPTDPSSTTSPLAGSGTVMFTGGQEP